MVSVTPVIKYAVMRNSVQDNVLLVKHRGSLVIRVMVTDRICKTCRFSHAHTDAAVSEHLNSADEQTLVWHSLSAFMSSAFISRQCCVWIWHQFLYLLTYFPSHLEISSRFLFSCHTSAYIRGLRDKWVFKVLWSLVCWLFLYPGCAFGFVAPKLWNFETQLNTTCD